MDETIPLQYSRQKGCELKLKEKTSENLISQTTILSMGFTKSMIANLLSDPILRDNPRYKSAAPMKLWKEADVLNVMGTEAFQAEAAKAARRKAGASKGVETKRENARVLADELISTIHVQRVDLPELEELALQAQQDWYDLRERGEIINPDREDVERWMVNYIRHNLCEYDNSLYVLFRPGKMANKDILYPKVKCETLAKIARVYPELAEECKKQAEYYE